MGAYIINTYYLPEWFQVVKGATPLHSGVMTLPAVISQVVVMIVSGMISKFSTSLYLKLSWKC